MTEVDIGLFFYLFILRSTVNHPVLSDPECRFIRDMPDSAAQPIPYRLQTISIQLQLMRVAYIKRLSIL